MPDSQRLLLAFLLLCCIAAGLGKLNPNAPPPQPVKSDVKYIRCQVCEALTKNAYRQVKAARDQLKPGKKLSEMAIIEITEKVTDPLKTEGEWITKIDLKESGPELRVVEMDEVGECGSECKTVQKAAEEVMGEHDTDLAEELWKGTKTRAKLSNWFCYDLTKACLKKPPMLPRDRKPGPPFKVADPKELELQKMMANMKASGMGGQLYDRESMMQKYMDGYDDDDFEDMADEAGLPKTAPAAGKETDGVQGKLNKVAEAAQAGLDAAKDTLEAGLGAAKKGLSSALGGAQKLVSGWTTKGNGPADSSAPSSDEL